MSARVIVGSCLFAFVSLAVLPALADDVAVPVRHARVDESALRYYASQKQNARVEAETQRLKQLHPGWSPPQDLWTAAPGHPDDAPMWELFAADKIDELRTLIAARRAKNPQWQLSSDLAQKLQRKELHTAILANAKAGRWTAVVASSQAWLAEPDVADVEVLWQIAEGYARARRMADAQRIFEDILSSSDNAKERVATIQKALGLLPMTAADRLIDSAHRDAAGRSEFADIAIDITRARVSAFLHDAPGKDVTPDELAAFQDFASGSSDPNQPALLAWYALKRADLTEALEQFKAAIAKGGDATVAHGLAHTLRRTGRLREAEEVAYAWRGPSAPNAILFIDILADQLTQGTIAIDAKRLTRYAEVTLQTASGEGAQALGWYAYNSCQLDAASEWFKRAVAWMPKETTAFGYALTLRRQKRTQDYIDIVNRYDGLFPKVVALMYPAETDRTDPCNRDLGASPVVNPLAPLHVPLPSGLGRVANADAGPKRTEFPILVSPENPYRSFVVSPVAGPRIGVAMWRPMSVAPSTLDARRVFGVGPMPYERFGKSVLPGFNGLTQPSLSQDLALQAPRGTLWSDERARQDAASAQNMTVSSNSNITGATAATRFHR